MQCVWDVHPCRFKHQKPPKRYEKIDSKYSWCVTVYTRLWQVYTSIWQVYTKSSLYCVFITFDSRITCSLHVMCMMAYSNIRNLSPSMKNAWWHYAYIPSYTSIFQHIPSYDGISRYMPVWQGVRIPDASWPSRFTWSYSPTYPPLQARVQLTGRLQVHWQVTV